MQLQMIDNETRLDFNPFVPVAAKRPDYLGDIPVAKSFC